MKKLEVRFTRQPGEERIVGQLAEAGLRSASQQVYFEYDPAFLRHPLWLSPFKLPPQPGLIEHRDFAFGPIFDDDEGNWELAPTYFKLIGNAIEDCLARL